MTTTQTETNPAEEARKIWQELDQEEANGGVPQARHPDVPIESNAEQPTEDQTDGARAQETGSQSGEQAPDESSPGAEAAPQDKLLDKVAGLETQLSQALNRLRQAEGRIGTLNSQLQQQQQVARQVSAKGGDAPTAQEIAGAQRNPEAMAKLKQDYPEFGEALESALREELAAIRQQIPQGQQQQPAVTHEDMARIQVEIRHPGWLQTVKTPEFAGWLQRQPRERQMLAGSADPEDAVRLLDLYKGDNKPAAPNPNQRRLNSAAALPSGRPGASVRQKAIEDMTPQEYWRYLDQVEAQQQRG